MSSHDDCCRWNWAKSTGLVQRLNNSNVKEYIQKKWLVHCSEMTKNNTLHHETFFLNQINVYFDVLNLVNWIKLFPYECKDVIKRINSIEALNYWNTRRSALCLGESRPIALLILTNGFLLNAPCTYTHISLYIVFSLLNS